MKKLYRNGAFYVSACLCVAIGLHSERIHAESYPDFSKAHWEEEVKNAKSKIWRGAALGALGIASIAPTTILTLKAVKDPKRYLAYAALSGIATLGMNFHGFFSIKYGRYQRSKAKHFASLYDTEVNIEDERAYYLESRRTTTRKMITFGSVLLLQSAVMLANGIVLSVQKHKGTEWGNIKAWPSYLLGGLLLPSSTFLIVSKVRYMGDLNRLENQTAASQSVTSIQPFFGYDPRTGGYNVGVSAQISY